MDEAAARFQVALITQPLDRGGVPILRNYLDLLTPVVDRVYFITDGYPGSADKVIVLPIGASDASGRPLPVRILRLLIIQAKICARLSRLPHPVNIAIFHIGSDLYLPAMLWAKLRGLKLVRFVVGRHSHFAHIEFGLMGRLLTPVFKLIETFSFVLADQINVLSASAVSAMGLGRYCRKIVISGAQYIDPAVFHMERLPVERQNLVGHIGGLSPRKGALNFAQAMPLVIKERNDVHFLIAGSGSPADREAIQNEIKSNGLESRVALTEWLPGNQFPARLNELKIFILASYEEGLPATVQQAMACGAVPLVTAVGGLPDLVKDGETGFILESNEPAAIAKGILRALAHPELERVAMNAARFINENYGRQKLVEGCRTALCKLVGVQGGTTV